MKRETAGWVVMGCMFSMAIGLNLMSIRLLPPSDFLEGIFAAFYVLYFLAMWLAAMFMVWGFSRKWGRRAGSTTAIAFLILCFLSLIFYAREPLSSKGLDFWLTLGFFSLIQVVATGLVTAEALAYKWKNE